MAKNKRIGDRESNNSFPRKPHSPSSLKGFSGPLSQVLALWSLALIVFLIYSNTLQGPFVFDDVSNIENNAHIRLTNLSLEGITRAGFESPSSHRPVPNISFALNYYVHKYDLLGYHLVNILIHIITGILLYLFVKTTLALPSLHSSYERFKWIPFITALIWLVHPLQTQSVTYIVQRMNSMAAMFYVLSFWLYARARLAEGKRMKRALMGGCILAGILSLGSKEVAATLPFFIFLYEWYFFQDLSRAWLKRRILYLLGVFILFVIVALMYLGGHPVEKILTSYATRDFTATQRVLTEFRVVIYYITLLLFPHPSRLNLDRDFLLSHSLLDPITTLLSMGTIGVFIGLAIYMAKKDRLLSFCILWFLGNLLIESSVIGLEIIFEHRTYLPSMFVSLMAVTLGYRYIKQTRIRLAVLCAAVLFFSFWTYQRNSIWRDDVTLWRDCVNKSPNKARPHLNLGVALGGKGKVEEAMRHYYVALRIKPDYAEVHYNLGVALMNRGTLKEAISHLSEAVRIKPRFASAHLNLGAALNKQGKINEAMKHFSEALRIRPDYAEAHNNLGAVLDEKGKLREAVGHYSEALRIKPDYGEAHNNLGVVLANQGRFKEAIRHFSEALRIRPHDAEIHCNLGNALASQGKFKEAKSHYVEALRIDPKDAQSRRNLEHVLRLIRKSADASNTVERP